MIARRQTLYTFGVTDSNRPWLQMWSQAGLVYSNDVEIIEGGCGTPLLFSPKHYSLSDACSNRLKEKETP